MASKKPKRKIEFPMTGQPRPPKPEAKAKTRGGGGPRPGEVTLNSNPARVAQPAHFVPPGGPMVPAPRCTTAGATESPLAPITQITQTGHSGQPPSAVTPGKGAIPAEAWRVGNPKGGQSAAIPRRK